MKFIIIIGLVIVLLVYVGIKAIKIKGRLYGCMDYIEEWLQFKASAEVASLSKHQAYSIHAVFLLVYDTFLNQNEYGYKVKSLINAWSKATNTQNKQAQIWKNGQSLETIIEQLDTIEDKQIRWFVFLSAYCIMDCVSKVSNRKIAESKISMFNRIFFDIGFTPESKEIAYITIYKR